MINHEINKLLAFSLKKGLIQEDDKIYSSNMLAGLFNLDNFYFEEISDVPSTATAILNQLLAYAVKENLINDTVAERDLFDTKIMNCVMPRPSEVINNFNRLLNNSPKEATSYYYKLSIASNYIRKDRIDKNITWKTPTEYGDLDITINLSKPEKDPRDIAKAKLSKSTSYPKCLLCKENEGFYGNINHPARQTLRIIPLELNKSKWFLQYSPYTYYNEHCIILNNEHIPMKISRITFENLLSFIDILPHYFAGSNADLPIVGGSILSHDHYQGGRYTFAMEKAPVEKEYSIKGYEDISVGRVKWPMSVIRISSKNKTKLINLAEHILTSWRNYSDKTQSILSHTGSEPHNTITPIARKRNEEYELDLVLRNNRTDENYPLGIFHPHNEVHHIKKENIGLIEVMGLAVLPARLKSELALIKENLIEKKKDISNDSTISKHNTWYKYILDNYKNISEENIDCILKKEVGIKFLEVLKHAGVFKRNSSGLSAFDKFINIL
ncbi:UDPglucose--hexose-1-phosphate uridylyltransferase [Clostridium acetobutylicum]|uniref:Galactose-1-phosphate uridylyltransferase n=1 Tax=Clostridium acetobutylicum (strain ATCC 824 / DSM 792 / JCM 1419 / IAM 19013 / LMG 5710 / NBRC 13948 / NRRL B-527 / VKM B-1787 / 2291 / W) TaxID=272562 RepID=GALT_CLOAB|nr:MULTISPECIES: UDP-glucose--hexose-1-phosphate uridylyltransferase [Clostridium]Q97EZ4.1 RecName: Full=Galactose-1-phosphate uridylyltransferase; Short=Gal-1-P uridylyltransferase; AltName: Full=UDP-glucose--hexose-1-phosphate uridylyltransferase [Clostridium acetobutylicum ATCC 824]AAK80903.1 Galactose-1-phosphate uridyltransferase [Clostridium acetobutylicum ATCC 824]ADZ22005.1 galactose-1-phosphate uridylyltransferase [Clostridium acetobutylicum EA 2018]AEI34427.1 galactose-1-phosphate uri